MTTRYQLRGDLGHAAFEDRTILLDIQADRYWQLPQAAAPLLAMAQRGEPFSGTEAGLGQLLELGFLIPRRTTDDHVRYADLASIVVPQTDLFDAERPHGSPGILLAAQAASCAIAVRAELRARPLRRILAGLARPRRPARRRAGCDLARLAWIYADLCRLLPVRPRCLPDSLALLRIARRHGHAPRLIFGVQPAPFAAHCWLQHGSQILTDRIDHVRRFTPLLAL